MYCCLDCTVLRLAATGCKSESVFSQRVAQTSAVCAKLHVVYNFKTFVRLILAFPPVWSFTTMLREGLTGDSRLPGRSMKRTCPLARGIAWIATTPESTDSIVHPPFDPVATGGALAKRLT